MAEPFIGEIRMFGFDFAPKGWAECDGQLLAVAQNGNLASILGTMYGGDGKVEFGLPDMRGTIPICRGQGDGLSNYFQGQRGGTEAVALTVAQYPSHGHQMMANNSLGDTPKPAGASLARYANAYQTNVTAADTPLALAALPMAGKEQPHNNLMPYVTLRYCIALEGAFPTPPSEP